MEETTKTPTPETKKTEAKSSLMLGIAAVIIIVLGGLLLTANRGRITVSQAETIAQELLDATSTAEARFVLDSVEPDHGLFLVTFHVEAEGIDPFEQQMRLSQDGFYLLPEALNMSDLFTQLAAEAAAQEAAAEANLPGIVTESGEATIGVESVE